MHLNNYHFYNPKNYLYSKPTKGLKVFEQGYRFAFKGKEKDNEVKECGNSYDFGERMHDPRLGRLLSLDPLAKQFPNESNYSYAGNSPISLVDYKGKKKIYYIHIIELDGSQTTLKIVDNNIVKTVITYTRESVGAAGVNLYTTQVANTETFDVYQNIFINKQTGKTVFGENKQGDLRSNDPVERWIEDNMIDVEKKGNYSGIGWIGETGQGEETKKGDGNRIESIDELASLLGLTKSAAAEGGASALLKTINSVKDFAEKVSASQTFVETFNGVDKSLTKNKSAEPVDSVICNGGACKGKPVAVKDTATGHSGPYEPVKK